MFLRQVEKFKLQKKLSNYFFTPGFALCTVPYKLITSFAATRLLIECYVRRSPREMRVVINTCVHSLRSWVLLRKSASVCRTCSKYALASVPWSYFIKLFISAALKNNRVYSNDSTTIKIKKKNTEQIYGINTLRPE